MQLRPRRRRSESAITDCSVTPTATPTAFELAIKRAAVNFEGLHNCPVTPSEGCMWSVDQVLNNGGGSTIGGGTYNIDTDIAAALAKSPPQITIEPASYKAQPGDLVDWWGGDGQTTFGGCRTDQSCGEHIGVCLNAGCSSAIANSSSASIAAGECGFTDSGSAANPQGQSPSFTSSTIIHVNY
jgi:hypothetical protein